MSEKQKPPNEWSESFRQILESLDDLVLVKGPNSKVLWANKAFCEYYGMTAEELRGIIDAPFSDPDHTQAYVEHDAYVFESGKVLDIPREPITRHDGVVRTMHTVKSPIFDSNGRVIMTVGISRDITDRLETDKTREEQRALSVYATRLAMLGEMAGGMAHEINTPLAVILMRTSQIREMLEEGEFDRDLFLSSAKIIESTTQRIAKIILGLRHFSREGTEEKFVRVDSRHIVESALSLCRERILSRGIKIDVILPETEMPVDCNPTQLTQVLLNLFLNAQDAVTKLAQRWIRVEVRDDGKGIEISVVDSGDGIPGGVREKIFNPFFTTKEVGQGPGLGLSVSRSMMVKHGGSLDLDEKAENTRFKITLPRAA